jgi:PTS system galactitol-specific IIC component
MLNANPGTMKKRLGIIGEPMVIGLILGVLLGIGSRYEIKKVLELGFSISAVIYILPKMCEILGEGLMPISEGMKEYLKKRFPQIGKAYIGIDSAVLV